MAGKKKATVLVQALDSDADRRLTLTLEDKCSDAVCDGEVKVNASFDLPKLRLQQHPNEHDGYLLECVKKKEAAL